MIDQVHVAEFIANAEGPEALFKEHQNLLSNDFMRQLELCPANLKNLSPEEQKQILMAFNISYINDLSQTQHQVDIS